MTLFKTTIWQTLTIYTNTNNQSDTKDTFSIVVFILFFISFAIPIVMVVYNGSKQFSYHIFALN